MDAIEQCPVQGLGECGLPDTVWIVRCPHMGFRTVHDEGKPYLSCFADVRVACRRLSFDIRSQRLDAATVERVSIEKARLYAQHIKAKGLAIYDLGTVRYVE